VRGAALWQGFVPTPAEVAAAWVPDIEMNEGDT
jgi:hypothetical protein